MPVIQAAPTFTGNGVFSSDVYLAGGTSEWYVNTVSLRWWLLLSQASLPLQFIS
jgi:hypothetical protein